MSLSAAFLATLGAGITFLPQELLAHVGAQHDGTPVLLMQLLGALYLGFAALNWMNRGNRIGGIYSRPICVANFVNFVVGALALLKGAIALPFAFDIAAMTAIYSLFGVWFGVVLFSHPGDKNREA